MNTVTSLLHNYILIKARGVHNVEISKQSLNYALSLCNPSVFKIVIDLSDVQGRISNIDRFDFISFAAEKTAQLEQKLNIKVEIIFLLQSTEVPKDGTSQHFAKLLNLNIRTVTSLDETF